MPVPHGAVGSTGILACVGRQRTLRFYFTAIVAGGLVWLAMLIITGT
jgi:hypothetical protein